MLRVSKENIVYSMSAKNEPVLTVPSGSTVIFETCDCFEDQIQSTDTAFDGLDWSRINPATGPVFVENANIGDVLAVHINTIKLSSQAVMVTAPSLGVIGDRLNEAQIRLIPVKDNFATLGNVQIPLNPMIGVIGTAPAGEPIPCGTPDAHGGNMDCKIITEGTTLYLPVNTSGALFALGDLHAAMGDGEVSVCGMEISGEVSVTLSVIKDRKLPTPMAQTSNAIYTIASAVKLDDAANMATTHMVDFIHQNSDLSEADSINLMSVGGNLQICQIVDPLKTCRYELPKSIASQINLTI